MNEITNHTDLQGLKRRGPGTRDARKFYEKFGFGLLWKPEIMMKLVYDAKQ